MYPGIITITEVHVRLIVRVFSQFSHLNWGLFRDQNLPVMVWIYGGGFIFGTTEMYPGQDLAIHGDVIYVGVNYRLTALGFLATGRQL